jgi:hypothetical protein
MSYVLGSGASLALGNSLTSLNGLFRLTLRNNGDLVLRRVSPPRPLWRTRTANRGVLIATMQGGGNFVLEPGIWQASTGGNPGAQLFVQDDGNVVIYNARGGFLWSTGTP